jgi:tRNA-modifying protein YgfZ
MSTDTQTNPTAAFPSSGTASLAQWGLILVEGPDSASFLQSQLSNSVLGLEATQPPKIAQSHNAVRLVGYCNPKGRLLASAWLGLFPKNPDTDRFALFLSRDIAATTAKRLSMFVLRSKVTVTDVSESWSIFGVYGSSTALQDQINIDSLCLQMPEVLLGQASYTRILIAQPKQTALNAIDATNKDLNDQFWNYLEVMSAIPRIVHATQEQFVPQMINFESVSGVDFKKGCYPGQEIVARSQYRGVIKRRLQLAHLDNSSESTPITPGTELFHTNEPEQPAGMIVLSAPNPTQIGRIDFQIECKLDALESGEIHIGSVHGPVLKIDSLPYSLIDI